MIAQKATIIAIWIGMFLGQISFGSDCNSLLKLLESASDPMGKILRNFQPELDVSTARRVRDLEEIGSRLESLIRNKDQMTFDPNLLRKLLLHYNQTAAELLNDLGFKANVKTFPFGGKSILEISSIPRSFKTLYKIFERGLMNKIVIDALDGINSQRAMLYGKTMYLPEVPVFTSDKRKRHYLDIVLHEVKHAKHSQQRDVASTIISSFYGPARRTSVLSGDSELEFRALFYGTIATDKFADPLSIRLKSAFWSELDRIMALYKDYPELADLKGYVQQRDFKGAINFLEGKIPNSLRDEIFSSQLSSSVNSWISGPARKEIESTILSRAWRTLFERDFVHGFIAPQENAVIKGASYQYKGFLSAEELGNYNLTLKLAIQTLDDEISRLGKPNISTISDLATYHSYSKIQKDIFLTVIEKLENNPPNANALKYDFVVKNNQIALKVWRDLGEDSLYLTIEPINEYILRNMPDALSQFSKEFGVGQSRITKHLLEKFGPDLIDGLVAESAEKLLKHMRGRIEAFGRIENEINERLSGFPELNQMFASKQSDAMKRAVVDPTNPQVERLYDSNAQVDDEMMNIPIFFRSQIGIEDSNRVAESIARSDAGSRVKILQELVNNGEAKIDGVVLRPSLAHFPIKPADVEWLSRNISKFDELLDSLALDEGELYGVTFLRSREQLERMYEKSQKHGFPPELASLLIRHGFLDFSRNAQEFEQAAKRIGATRQEVTRVVRDMRKYLAVDEKIVATHLRDTSTPSIEELILRNISSARGILRSSGLLEADVVKCFVR